jgi:hypothetical protein
LIWATAVADAKLKSTATFAKRIVVSLSRLLPCGQSTFYYWMRAGAFRTDTIGIDDTFV